MSNFFVKFVPWNEKILSSIINKTIKFSTVYEFNNFNEYGYLSSISEFNDFNEQINSILEKEILSISFLNNFLTYSSEYV